MIDGYEVAAKCSFVYCKSKGPPVLFYNAKTRILEHRCPRCGIEWKRTRAWVPKASMGDQKPPMGSFEAPLVRLATWGKIIEDSLDEWQIRIYPPYVLWQGPGRADQGVADCARVKWPKAPWKISRYRVNELVDSSRLALDARLESEGML